MAELRRTLNPERMPFLWPRLAGVLFLVGVLAVVLLGAAALTTWWVLLLLPLLTLPFVGLSLYAAHVAYGKERYEVHDDHLVRTFGGLLSDGRNELDVRNITHVRLRLPWLRHRFFRIGDVRVESAGSAGAEITFESVKEPEALYELLQEVMRENGYALTRGEVLHQESPTPVGAASDVVQTVGGALFALAWIGLAGFGGLIGVVQESGIGLGLLLPVLGLVVPLGLIAVVCGPVVRYLDVVRRTYTVYDDVVEYTEGFLTCDNAFIPYENIADAGTNRSPIDQLLGLYDVSVSCQGSGSEVLFRRLSDGPALQGAISRLVAAARTLDRPAGRSKPKAEGVEQDSSAEAPVREAKRREIVAAEDAWTADLKMDLGRALVGTLPLLLTGPMWLLAVGLAFIRATNTTYRVGVDALSSEYAFIGSTNLQFAYDKVTGVQVVVSPFDRFFGTQSIHIWSIGAPQPLVLQHVSAEAVDLPALLRQCGIPAADPTRSELSQSFGPKVWLVQNLVLFVVLALVALGTLPLALFFPPILLLTVLCVLYPLPSAVLVRMRVERQRVTFHDSHLEARTGILFQHHTYARYDSVKKVQSVAIPFTDQGRLKVFVAGERVIQQGNNATQIVPYAIEAGYIEGIHDRVDTLDALLEGRIEPSEAAGPYPREGALVRSVQPAVANDAVVLGVIGLVVWPLLLGLPLRIWQLKVTRYDIETDRVVHRSGILFRSATSVLYDRIDSMQQTQGALGKAFSNGSVTLLTAGSSAPDLVITNVPEHGSVYAAIRERYGQS